MDPVSFDALTRRASLVSAGATGLAALATPMLAEGKKKKKTKKGDVNKLCKQQVGECTDFLLPLCMGDPQCLVQVPICCEEFATCDSAGFLNCLLSLSS
jgi:hypothetical protein